MADVFQNGILNASYYADATINVFYVSTQI